MFNQLFYPLTSGLRPGSHPGDIFLGRTKIVACCIILWL